MIDEDGNNAALSWRPRELLLMSEQIPASSSGGSLPIAPPLVLENADALNWAKHCDVLVVGLGAAGAAAAITAKEGGTDVL
ncbi:MAG: hypothetical protein ACRETE_04505, partial [Stenotrophobium sp.]